MFNLIRSHQRIMQFVLLILILPSFVLIGVSSYTNFTSSNDELIKIGDTALTEQEFDRARRNQLDTLQRQYGASFDPAMVNNPEARSELINSLIDRLVLVQVATSEGFSVSDTLLRNQIAAIPELQENGTFSAERYNQVLAASGISVKDFEQSQRAELAIARVLEPITSTVQLPQPVMATLEEALTTARTIQQYNLHTAEFVEEVVITDNDLQAWYDNHQDELRLPQHVDVDFIVLDEAAAVASVPAIDEAQLEQYYEQNRNRFITPARVQLRHILFATTPAMTEQERNDVRAQAESIQASLVAAPDTFISVAEAESDDLGSSRNGGELGWVTQGTWPAELEAGIFSLAEGEVSGVVQGPDGFHIFKADEVVAESGPAFAEVKDEVEAEVRQQLAAERFADMATQLTNLAYENADSLNAAADALGLTVQHAKGIARDGIMAAADIGEQAAADSPYAAELNEPSIRQALFSAQSLVQRQNAGVIELAADKLVAIRATTIHEPQIPPFERVKAQIHQRLLSEAAQAKATERGEALLAELTAGQELEELPFSNIQAISRLDNGGLDKAAIDAIMGANLEALPTYVGFETETGYSVVKVMGEEKTDLDPALMNFISQQLQQLWARAEEQATLQAMRDSLKVEEFPALQRVIEADDSAI
ncbi:MAG TPA: SurA N-terminal domain-containing protein [Paenalcaligenes sp.]|nr:SurA N-terminal domain-containing protein [Paenalcaligenes sp.]